ncbi:MAG TPA: hypothetical protein VLG40_02890 [Candidatus Saccharimonas sp.]|nr:hypothetical protein [Candidatus Saccharimonas sp.]
MYRRTVVALMAAAALVITMTGCNNSQQPAPTTSKAPAVIAGSTAFAYFESAERKLKLQQTLDTLGREMSGALRQESIAPLIVRDVKSGKPTSATRYGMLTTHGDNTHAFVQVVLPFANGEPTDQSPVELCVTTTAGIKYVLYGSTTFDANNDPVVGSPMAFSWSIDTAETTINSVSLTADSIDLNHPRESDTNYKVLGYKQNKLTELTHDDLVASDAHFLDGLQQAVNSSGWL